METKNGWLFFANRNLALAETIADNPNFTAESISERYRAFGRRLRSYFGRCENIFGIYAKHSQNSFVGDSGLTMPQLIRFWSEFDAAVFGFIKIQGLL